MKIGWNSRKDTFFITDLTDAEAGALQGTISSVFTLITEGQVSLGPTRLGNNGFILFLCDFQRGLFKAKQIKNQIMEK